MDVDHNNILSESGYLPWLELCKAQGARLANAAEACAGQQTTAAQTMPAATAVQQTFICSTGYKKPWLLLLNKQLERDRNMAVLLLEKRLMQLNQQLAESSAAQTQYAQRLEQSAALHKQQLRDAEAASKAQMEAIKAHVAQHLQQQTQRQQHQEVLRLCFYSLGQHACCQRGCKRIRDRVQQRRLQHCFVAWESQRQQIRSQMLQQLTAEQADLQLQQQLLLAIWQQQAKQLQQWHAQQLAAAVRWHRRRVLRKAFSTWSKIYWLQQASADRASAHNSHYLLHTALQAWVQAAEDVSMQPRSAEAAALVQHCFAMWQSWVSLKHKQTRLQQIHQCHTLQHAVQAWMRATAAHAVQRDSAVAALAAADAKLHRHWGMRAFQQQLQESHARLCMQQWRLQRCLVSWKLTAHTAARMHRVLAARAAVVRQWQPQRSFVIWWHKTALASKQTAAQQADQLKDALCAQQAMVESANAREAAAVEQLKLLVIHNQQLQQQAVDANRGVLTSMQFFPALHWRSLLFNPGEGQMLPRARHVVVKLDILQPPAAVTAARQHSSRAAQSPWHSIVAGAGGCLLVFGGVSGNTWLADLTMLVIEEQPAGGIRLKALPIPNSTSAAASQPASRTDVAHGARQLQLPLAVRDFAACACGQNQFVVTGGFCGHLDTFDLQLCQLQQQRQQQGNQLTAVTASSEHTEPRGDITGAAARNASATAASDGFYSVQNTTVSCNTDSMLSGTVPSWYHGWAASWQLIHPRNSGPPGRCHHSVGYYAEGKSLVVFGGWADRRGCLNDLWLFHHDHLEWWQPETTGALPCQRRSHAAALVGHKLFVHGGLESSGMHLADMWCLDMQTWQWNNVTPAAAESLTRPAGRRAHCMEVVAERYLLLHGGYAGEGLLGDTWVYDTCTSRWLAVDVSAPASELPVPRALHTVTVLDGRLVVLGGQGPQGPLGDVHMLECPALQQGLHLQQQQQCAQQHLVHIQQRCMQFEAELTCSKSKMQEAHRQLQAAKQDIGLLQAGLAAAANQCSAMHAKLNAAQSGTVAAEQIAQQACHQVEALERRLDRARQGGTKAVDAAHSLEQQLRSTEESRQVLHQQLHRTQQQLQEQQSVLHERNAELAVLRSELVQSSARVTMVAAASESAQLDQRTALTRSNKLHTQELNHLRQLLQAARKCQKQLTQELVTLQTQKATGTSAAEAAQATATCTTAATAALGAPPPTDSGRMLPQQPGVVNEVMCCQMSAAAAVAKIANCSSSNCDSSSRVATDDGWQYMGDAVGCQTAQLLCVSADQLAAISSRQGRAQAQLELLQKQVFEQQGENTAVKQQLQEERTAARVTATNESKLRAAALQQMHVAEQQHQQHVQQLEEQVKQYKWKLWELQADPSNAARNHHKCANNRMRGSQVPAVWSSAHTVPTTLAAAEHTMNVLSPAEDVENAFDTTAGAVQHDCTGCGGAAAAATATQVAQALGGSPAGTSGEFTVQLVPKLGPADQLEMLPEVVKLFELHRETMF